MFSTSSSSLLELEAADYFKLDPAQVNMLCNSLSASQKESSSVGAAGVSMQIPMKGSNLPTKAGTSSKQAARHRSTRSESGQTSDQIRSCAGPGPSSSISPKNRRRPSQLLLTRGDKGESHLSNLRQKQHQDEQQQQQQQQQHPICSSTVSTNSLPSISSSPSISPSLVCPHLTLDDILAGRYVSRSPHTIGLCDSCKLDPPPNIHSPLSPAFKPSTMQYSPTKLHQVPADQMRPSDAATADSSTTRRTKSNTSCNIKRGYSDFQERTRAANFRNRPGYFPIRDDSLDFYMDPSELRRSQMSPIQRKSVEFIRKYSTEVGRVLKVYKNGQAFEKPLRICIARNEFANLNQLLDHINSRQLIACGARYLFHLDGQLVYSVNELKHGSSYIVSGTRNFDTKASTMIKEQQQRQLNQAYHLHEQSLQRRLLDRRSSRSLSSLGQLASCEDSAETAVAALSYNTSRAEAMVQPQVKSSRQQSRPATLGQARKAQNNSDTTTPRSRKATDRETFEKSVRNANPLEACKKKGASDKRREIEAEKSRSSENLNGEDRAEAANKPKVGNLSRAKSELTSSALKRKKNVTFMDTGQMASPVMRRFEDELGPSGADRIGTIGKEEKTTTTGQDTAANSNEIGIQVSDSIDGYLIDLPLPLPKRGEEKREQEEGRRRFVATKRAKASGRVPSKAEKIVTITERDLSLDEMDQLKDLDHGDHHNEPHKVKHVVIKLDSLDASTSTMDADPPANAAASSDKNQAESSQEHQSDSINEVGLERAKNDTRRLDQLIKRTIENPDLQEEAKVLPTDEWQYPGGQRSSATPEERPVSQNEPNGVMHARVTTPTPSLSTVGDNNSLTMSYDGVRLIDGRILQQQGSLDKTTVKRSLPAKNHVPVLGKLSDGLEAPGRNFKLTWVNGFTINDMYPENSTTAASIASTAAAAAATTTSLVVESTTTGGGSQRGELLSPSRQATVSGLQRSAVQFKPSERFRNWICHSRVHDELIYPAGCLIVLWCRWTNEQRYYSRHLTNVSAITLAPTQPDVLASSESGGGPEQLDQATNHAVVHLWSSTSLQTLMIIDEPVHFRGFKVFSLNLRKLAAEQSWSLLVSSKDERQPQMQQLLCIRVEEFPAKNEKDSSVAAAVGKISILKATRALQANQMPLLVTQVPIDTSELSSSPKKNKPQPAATPTRELLLSFGRRHFQLWSPDWSRKKLQLMQAGEKSGAFVEIMTRSNCLARLAPNEFIVGDSLGNIALVTIKLAQQQTIPSKSSALKLSSSPKSSSSTVSKYNLEIVHLVEQQSGGAQQKAEQTPIGQIDSVTSLTRISGSIFASGHSNCAVRFWKIDRSRESNATSLSCRQLTCISLPPDLGFICSIVSSAFDRKKDIVEFYLISTSNAILFGSIQLASLNPSSSKSGATADVLAHSSLSVVYEGHETSVTNLVADSTLANNGSNNNRTDDGHYFTCSLDLKICKWRGKNLVWKSMLPSGCVSLAVHPTGFVLAIGSLDGTVYVLDKISGLLISYFPLTPVCINCLSYSGDGSLLAAGCSNGSIFILPVQENGLKYKKVSIFQSPFPVVSLQFSLDNRYMLTSVTHSHYQDLILWDLPNFRYMRDNVKIVADKISWFEPVCSGSEDVRAIWENVNLTSQMLGMPPLGEEQKRPNRLIRKRPSTIAGLPEQQELAVNLSCHRLIEDPSQGGESLCIASDTRGHLRLFRYPCRDIEQAFYQTRVTSSRLNCCRFLAPQTQSFVSSALDGSIFLWSLE